MSAKTIGTILLCALLLVSTLWAVNLYQSRNMNFGVSGGNVSDISTLYCCSGTLGALLVNNSVQYVLSNNHVLARSDQAVVGEDISQPGLIDNGCRPGTIVADFTVAPKLGSNVDAAIAQVRSGQMDPNGNIQGIGVPSSTLKAPSVGLAVMKSGRTTGTTTGTISSVNTSVRVSYQKGCGVGKKFAISYRNQVVITSSTFSAGGDSGSLIVSADPAHQPVALLYAGSSTSTIGNPIGEVISKLNAALGQGADLRFTGAALLSAQTAVAPSDAMIAAATQAANEHAPRWMANPQILGVGVGAADENPQEAVIVVYTDKTQGKVPDLPDQAKGFRLKRIATDPFIALGCCEKCR